MRRRTRKGQVFLTGAVGAFAPQILRWYSQGLEIKPDPWEIAGRAVVTLLFLALAGYVALLWDVRNLKEGFLVGLGVPSIILSAGSDLTSLAKVGQAWGQPLPATGTLVVQARSEQGDSIADFRVLATDDMARTYAAGRQGLLLPPGKYRVVVEAGGYHSVSRTLVVEPGRTTRLDVTLPALSAYERFFKGILRPFEQKRK
jgi:hypothetical protein